MKRIYLEHAAATPLDPLVLEEMMPFFNEEYGNPGSVHKEGVRAKDAVDYARKTLSEVLSVNADEILFTGGATESCNLAIAGVVHAWEENHRGEIPHVIVGSIEHHAVLEPVSRLEKRGVLVTVLPVDENGILDIGSLYGAITENTVLISVMHANNEIGTLQPILEIGKIVRKWKKEVRGVARDVRPSESNQYPLFHTDASQSANYCDLRIPPLGVDLLTLSSGKIYGPKGVGTLYVKRNTLIHPVVVGGGQERGLRAGTENVPGIVGFAKALLIASEIREEEANRLGAIQNILWEKLSSTPSLVLNGCREQRLQNNIHFSMPNTDHEYLALLLDAKGFAVSTKSACNEGDAETSHVLRAMRRSGQYSGLVSGIRVTTGRATREGDIVSFVETLREVLPMAQKL